MKTYLKSAFILCALIVGLNLSAGEPDISLFGIITSSNGQPLSKVEVRCSNSSDPSISLFLDDSNVTFSDADGIYQITAKQNQFITFKKSGFTPQQYQVTSSDVSQQHDVSMSSSSI